MIDELGFTGLISGMLAAVVLSVLGGIWFAVLFDKPYKAALGKGGEASGKIPPLFFIGPFVCGLVMAFTSVVLIYFFDISSVTQAIIFGSVVGVGYLASTSVNTAINPNIPRPLLYGLVSGTYFTVASIVSSVIIVLMR